MSLTGSTRQLLGFSAAETVELIAKPPISLPAAGKEGALRVPPTRFPLSPADSALRGSSPWQITEGQMLCVAPSGAVRATVLSWDTCLVAGSRPVG